MFIKSNQTTSRDMRSYWFSGIELLKAPSLQKNISTDILIIGAGMTGLLTAYLLSKTGKRVVVVDAKQILSGETGCTTAHLTWVLDLPYSQIEHSFGAKNARLVLESQKNAIDLIEHIIQEEKIECDFKRVDAYTFLGPKDKQQTLEQELKVLHSLGETEVRLVPKAPLNFLDTGVSLHYPRQAQFHPLKFLDAISKVIQKNGGEIFADTHIDGFGEGKAKTLGNEIEAHQIVVATHSPVINTLFFLKEAAYRSYVVACKIKKGEVPAGLFYDTDDPYHYVRTQPVNEETDLLIVGGADHKTGQNDNYEATLDDLEAWAKTNFPMFKQADYAWSGQIIESEDGLAFIGRSPYQANRYIASGYSGNGMTYSTIAAMIFKDMLLGNTNKWAEIYNPTRKSLAGAKDFLKENANVVKELIGEHLKGGSIERGEELYPGEGAIIKKGIAHQAVYRDGKGSLHVHSATCTHLGCVVQWNAAQKTFDCPCHGSRYSNKGEVLCGPAIRNLKSL